jgi:hypothetical protein
VLLEDYMYVPKLWINLFPIPKAIGNKGVCLFLTKGDIEVTFDHEFSMKKEVVLGVEMIPCELLHW